MMQYRNIGNTGLKVSEIGFGCGNNAVLMVKAGYGEQVRAVRHALDSGINYFDTAFAYGLGRSEENLGKILKELGANVVVSTKIRLEEDALGDVKAATIRAVEAALQRLQRERVDVIQLHTRVTKERAAGKRFSLTVEDVLGPQGVIAGFKAMRDCGRVGYFGFSGLGDVGPLHALVESGEFHGFQAYYNLLNPSAGQPVPPGFNALNYDLLIDRAAAKGMGVFVIRVLAAGALTADPAPGGGSSGLPLSPGSDYHLDLQRAEALKTVLKVSGQELTQIAIRFALMKQSVSSVLVGFSHKAHIDEAVACSGKDGLLSEQMNVIEQLWRSTLFA